MTIPAQIGRFEIEKVLGKGSQGVVYLGRDPRLDRRVAIKTIRVSASNLQKQQVRLIREAKLVGRLQHPNIVPLYEAGEDRGLLYLVFAYVSGVSLKDLIKDRGSLVVRQAIDLMIQILSGIQHAHEQGIVHRDLSPSNLLLDRSGLIRVMDFGISVIAGGDESIQKDVSGTPCYMSPEHFSKDPVTFQSDIFSLGLIFYEMVLGHPAVQADNYVAVMYKIASETLPPPSQENREIDKKLDEIFLRAVEKKPDVRYLNASKMREDLEAYLAESGPPEDDKKVATGHSTLDFLLRRIRHKGDFPSFSQNIMEINKKASASRANTASASELSNAILKDYSLTNKLLRLVNSAFYGQFAGTVTTVSRAVVVLGFDEVRMAASALLLFEHMMNTSHKGELKDQALKSFISGMVAKDMAERSGLKGLEESFICSMVHQLGRHLVLCYFPEEYEQIHSLMASKGVLEPVAARTVLGISYDDLGMGVARKWNFPDKIIRSMRSLPADEPVKAGNEFEAIQVLSSFSNELIDAINSEDENGNQKLQAVLARFKDHFPLKDKQLGLLLTKIRERVERFSNALDVNPEQSRLLKRMHVRAVEACDDPDARAAPPRGEMERQSRVSTFMETSELEVPSTYVGQGNPEDLQAVLINGIQEITNTLVGDYDLNDALTMIMETMYRGLSLQSVLLCVREGDRQLMGVRMGFGKDIQALSTQFRFPIEKKARDVFGLAVTQGKDIHIGNAEDPRIRKRIPDWYHQAVGDPSFALFPVVVNTRPFGLFFLGRDRTAEIFDEKNLNYLRTLRNQAVLAVMQKRGG